MPITLTEAFGCDRCQQIFVSKDAGQLLEQLSTHYPYKRVWYWTGQQWRLDQALWRGHYGPMILMMSGVGAFVILLALTQSALTFAVIMRLLTVATVLLLFVTVFWLMYRR